MARFFVDALPAAGERFVLTGENAEHARVLRLRPGESVNLCDGAGTDCPCTVAEGLTLLAGPSLPCAAEPNAAVSLWLAFPKADKAEHVIQKATELGAAELVFFPSRYCVSRPEGKALDKAEHVIQKATELGAAELVFFPSRYCVSRPEGKALDKKLERWQKIARSAAEQSGRGVIPAVRAADSFRDALRQAAEADLPILFYENEEQDSLRNALGSLPDSRTDRVRISLMTGAEGGFSAEEITQAREAGLRICTLGPRILRCETAPLAGLTAVLFALGEMD